jgi:hypothetical protein
VINFDPSSHGYSLQQRDVACNQDLSATLHCSRPSDDSFKNAKWSSGNKRRVEGTSRREGDKSRCCKRGVEISRSRYFVKHIKKYGDHVTSQSVCLCSLSVSQFCLQGIYF